MTDWKAEIQRLLSASTLPLAPAGASLLDVLQRGGAEVLQEGEWQAGDALKTYTIRARTTAGAAIATAGFDETLSELSRLDPSLPLVVVHLGTPSTRTSVLMRAAPLDIVGVITVHGSWDTKPGAPPTTSAGS